MGLLNRLPWVVRTIFFIASLLGLSGCGLGYVANAATYQVSMLTSRVPNLEARASGKLTFPQRQKLDIVEELRGFGSREGLKVGELYAAVALGWQHTIWNVSAAEPLAFKSATWWFPIVGTVPYLGFFTHSEATQEAESLRKKGLDIYVRKAGAYSTLGYFADPILPQMLNWSEWTLARVILHELTHATVWLPGSVNFNESVANFVGETAALKFLAAKYGPASHPVQAAIQWQKDRETWRMLLSELYQELSTLYLDKLTTREQKLSRKQRLFTSIKARVDKAHFFRPHVFESLAQTKWNNARLMQFRTYNNSQQYFTALLANCDNNLETFLKEISHLAARHSDPMAFLRSTYGPL